MFFFPRNVSSVKAENCHFNFISPGAMILPGKEQETSVGWIQKNSRKEFVSTDVPNSTHCPASTFNSGKLSKYSQGLGTHFRLVDHMKSLLHVFVSWFLTTLSGWGKYSKFKRYSKLKATHEQLIGKMWVIVCLLQMIIHKLRIKSKILFLETERDTTKQIQFVLLLSWISFSLFQVENSGSRY